jgi:putative holliday junction resolvase
VRPGVRLAVDVGSVRVGVARCDPSALLATPVETVRRDDGGSSDISRIADLVDELGVVEVIVGLPRSLSGGEGPAAKSARSYARALVRRLGSLPVRMVDERMSTVSAHRSLREAGVAGRKRRPVVDQAAAVVILQAALDAERMSGRPPGTLVVPDLAPDGPGPGEAGREAGPS